MSNIHPDWQQEDEAPVEVKVKQKPEVQPPSAPVSPGTISRRPAAIVGMLLVIGVGIWFFQGFDIVGDVNILGQVAPSGPTVTVTDEGIVPDRLEVEHGQTITFINNQDTPLSLFSNTLCSDTGFCLQTKTLDRGESDVFTITPDMRSGPYEFMSDTSGDIRGVLIIVTETADDFVDISSVLGNDFVGGNVNTTTPFPDTLTDALAANVFDQDPSSNPLPTNPYAIGSERIHPFDDSGNPVEEAFGDAPTTAQVSFAQTGGPMRQPETGAGGVVSLVLLSIATLWWSTRGMFASTQS